MDDPWHQPRVRPDEWVAAVTRLADVLAQYGVGIFVQGMTFGSDTVAVKLHDSGEHNGKTANLSDVSAFDDYFS
jgi:hypothetical protein